jgi:hypothetical protein
MKTTLCAMVLVALTLFAEESPTVTITGGTAPRLRVW